MQWQLNFVKKKSWHHAHSNDLLYIRLWFGIIPTRKNKLSSSLTTQSEYLPSLIIWEWFTEFQQYITGQIAIYPLSVVVKLTAWLLTTTTSFCYIVNWHWEISFCQHDVKGSSIWYSIRLHLPVCMLNVV